MQFTNTASVVTEYGNTHRESAVHSLKGSLMDKGQASSSRLLISLEHKTNLVSNAMRALCKEHQNIADQYGCNYLRLYFLYNERTCSGIGRGNKRVDPKVVSMGLQTTYHLVWLANRSLSKRTGGEIEASRRLSPFSPDQQNYSLVQHVLKQDAPDYYAALAAVENLRLTLNSAYKALRNLTVDIIKLNYEAGLDDMPEFSGKAKNMSIEMLNALDPTGQTTKTIFGLFEDVR